MDVLTLDEVLRAWGETPEQVTESLDRFSKTARVLSSSRPRLIDQHPQKWVGLFNGVVEVIGDTLEDLMAEIEARELPRSEVIVRFIDREEKTLFL